MTSLCEHEKINVESADTRWILRCNRIIERENVHEFDSMIEIEMNMLRVKYLMETKVTFYAVGGEEHFPVAGEYKQEPVQRL